ncbi:MAG: DUF5343 domain-containing protein [Salinarimonas sp.]
MDASTPGPAIAQKTTEKKAVRAAKKEIPSGLSYVNTPVLLKKVLDKIISAQQPDRITQSYMDTVWQFKGGSGGAVLSFLKKIGFLSPDGTPTDIYSKFRTDGGRSSAAKQALRKGFSDLFRQNEQIDQADENTLTDLVIGLTGRERSDQVVRAIVSTFKLIQAYITNVEAAEAETSPPQAEEKSSETGRMHSAGRLGLQYNINVVLPETTNVEVFNAIFRSLRNNLIG